MQKGRGEGGKGEVDRESEVEKERASLIRKGKVDMEGQGGLGKGEE
jgi:hypothetical protein